MDYKDRQGNIIKNTTNQDLLLKKMYCNFLGRNILNLASSRRVSRLVGNFMDSWISTFLIDSFIEKNKVNMRDYVPTRYRSYNEFFTRKIRKEMRPINRTPNHFIAPCDGKLSVYEISKHARFEIKNSYYSIESLLRNQKLAEEFAGGYCMIFRLTVDDYHRYCYVDQALKGRNCLIPGILHTVNPAVLDYINIYKENSRSYCILDTEHFGRLVQIEVGALLVGKIKNYHRVRKVYRGQEKGRFEFGGSTVVLLVGKDQIVPDQALLLNTKEGYETVVRMGEKVAVSIKKS